MRHSNLALRPWLLATLGLLAATAVGCREGATPVLTLRAPTLEATPDTAGWAAPPGEAPALRLGGVAGTLTVVHEVEQLATGGIELHARVEIEASVTLDERPGGVTVRVESARVRMAPIVEGRPKEVEATLAGATGAVFTEGGTLRFDPPDPSAPIGALLRALPWLLPGAFGDGRMAVPAPVPGGTLTLDVAVETEGRGAKDGLHAVRVRFEGAAAAGAAAMGPIGGPSAGMKGGAQLVTDAQGSLKSADAAVNTLTTARAADTAANPDLHVQQLLTTTARFSAGAR